jgi:hypothetical protein
MMTEREKLEQALKYFKLFDYLRKKVDSYAINKQTFNLGLKTEIEGYIEEIERELKALQE